MSVTSERHLYVASGGGVCLGRHGAGWHQDLGGPRGGCRETSAFCDCQTVGHPEVWFHTGPRISGRQGVAGVAVFTPGVYPPSLTVDICRRPSVVAPVRGTELLQCGARSYPIRCIGCTMGAHPCAGWGHQSVGRTVEAFLAGGGCSHSRKGLSLRSTPAAFGSQSFDWWLHPECG